MYNLVDLLEPYLGPPAKGPISSDTGTEYKYRCPFHKEGQERKPSFFLNVDKGVGYCQTCGEGWSVWRLLSELGVPRNMREAIVSAVDIQQEPPERRRRKQLAERSPEVPDEILGIFFAGGCPVSLLNRGFHMETLQRFEVGYDNRIQRITYPIRNLHGRLVGVAGGSDAGQEPKYLNYGPNEFSGLLMDQRPPKPFHRAINLWNIDRVWASAYRASDQDPLIVCEGYKAAMWVWQAGYKLVVGQFNATMSSWQANTLSHFANPIVLFLDHDKAGRYGTRHSFAQLQQEGTFAWVARYPDRVAETRAQPDDLTPQEIREAIEGRVLPCLTT